MRDLVRRLGHHQRLAPTGETRSTNRSETEQSDAAVGIRTESSQDGPSIIHIAGTKGKGSVATMVAQVLQASGHRVGLYTSPHLVHLEERFRVQGQPASPRQMIELIDRFRPVVDAMQAADVGGPSFFELTTALAVEHFHRCQCDVWVLETGLGGRLDSTNVFQSDLTAITSIGLDHQHVLGDTVEKIAAEKAGILKPGVPAISGVTELGPARVIVQKAEQVAAPLIQLGTDFFVRRDDSGLSAEWGESLKIDGLEPEIRSDAPIRLELEGTHQACNAALALAIARQLCRSTGRKLQPDALADVTLEARLEKFRRTEGQQVLLDAAHNTDSIEALVAVVKRRLGQHPGKLVFGTSADKDAESMLRRLAEVFDSVIVTRYRRNPRFVPVEQLAKLAEVAGFHVVQQIDDPMAALQTALGQSSPEGWTVVCGSFFLAAEVRPFLLSPDNNC